MSVNANNFNIDEASRAKFLQEYSADIYPLVSVIIPTFNRTKYFKLALESVLNQTYRNIEIVISDDGTNDDTEQLIQPYLEKYSFIKYFRNHGFTANDNWNFLRSYNNPSAEYVNWLMDDDLFMPRKLELMVEVYRNNPDVSLVTSRKHILDTDGKIISRTTSNVGTMTKISGDQAGKLLFVNDNYIGEPTTVLIRKKFLRDNDLCWNDDEQRFFPLVDVSTWFQLLSKGNMIYIDAPLSAFRSHSEQASGWTDMDTLFSIYYAKLLKTAWDQKIFLKTESDFRQAAASLMVTAAIRVNHACKRNYRSEAIIALEKCLAAMAQSLTNGYNIELPPLENLY